jgi:hypothetical protein
VDEVTVGQVSSEYFGFPCQFSFHQVLHNHLSSGTGTTGQLIADVPSGLRLAPSHENYCAISRHYLYATSGNLLSTTTTTTTTATNATFSYFPHKASNVARLHSWRMFKKPQTPWSKSQSTENANINASIKESPVCLWPQNVRISHRVTTGITATINIHEHRRPNEKNTPQCKTEHNICK